jgi:hypothetical protein
VATGVEGMQRYLDRPTPEALNALRAARSALEDAQNQYRHLEWGPVRVVESREALLVEDAIGLRPPPALVGRLGLPART